MTKLEISLQILLALIKKEGQNGCMAYPKIAVRLAKELMIEVNKDNTIK